MTVSRTVRAGRSSRAAFSSVSLAGALTSGSSTGICNPPSVAGGRRAWGEKSHMSTGGSALVVAKRIAMSGDAARRSACATSRPGLATGRLFGEILGDEEACFAAAHDVKVAVAIEILHGDLHAAAHAAAVIDDVADPLHCAGPTPAVLVPIPAEPVPFPRLGAPSCP